MSYGITNPAEEYFKDGLWGWDGSQWRKLQLLWGYTSHWAERNIATASEAGTLRVYSSIVPDGEVWVLQAVHCLARNTDGIVEIWLQDGGSDGVSLARAVNPGVWQGARWAGSAVLQSGGCVKGQITGQVVDDVIELGVWGYKMKIA